MHSSTIIVSSLQVSKLFRAYGLYNLCSLEGALILNPSGLFAIGFKKVDKNVFKLWTKNLSSQKRPSNPQKYWVFKNGYKCNRMPHFLCLNISFFLSLPINIINHNSVKRKREFKKLLPKLNMKDWLTWLYKCRENKRALKEIKKTFLKT